MNETANSSGQVQITTAWNILVCNMGKACGYEQTGFSFGVPSNFVSPIACKTKTTQTPGKWKKINVGTPSGVHLSDHLLWLISWKYVICNVCNDDWNIDHRWGSLGGPT